MSRWNEIPNDILYQIIDRVHSRQDSRDLVRIRAVCKAWREACMGYLASITATIQPLNLTRLSQSFPCLKSLRISPAGRHGIPQRLPDMTALENCEKLSDIVLIGFKYPQPRDVEWVRNLRLTRLVMENSQPAAVAMPFLLEAVPHLNSLKHLKISPPVEQRAGNCNHLFEHVCFRLPTLEFLQLGSAAFNKQFEPVPQNLENLTQLELHDCAIIPEWLGEVMSHLPQLSVLSLVRPMHPSEWPLFCPCGELSLTSATTNLRSLRIEGAMIKPETCNHLILKSLALGLPRAARNFETGITHAISLISRQKSLERLELISWDKVSDCSSFSSLSVKELSLIECSFDAYYELIGGVCWNSVTHLHAKDNHKPTQVWGLLGDVLFVKFFDCPNLKSVSGTGWIIRKLAEICEKLNTEDSTPSGFKNEAAHLKDIVFL